MYRQGKHVKTHTIITEEANKKLIIDYLKSISDDSRTPQLLCKHLNESLLRTIPNAPERVSEETARRWMHYLGYSLCKKKKGYYTDGHNREDVVKYRDEVFLKEMEMYEPRMKDYDGEEMKEKERTGDSLLLNDEIEIIDIWQDESTFYANDGKGMVWMANGTNKLRPKSLGSSLMISGLTCRCHGFCKNDTKKAYRTFLAGNTMTHLHLLLFLSHGILNKCLLGKNRDGWFTNDDLVEQVKDLFDLFTEMHPGNQLLFIFDNSMSHHKRAPDGLEASLLTLKDGGKNVPEMRKTFFIKNDIRYEQSMQHESGVKKGIKTILQERGRWRENMLLECEACKAKIIHEHRVEHYAGVHDASSPIYGSQCCARHCISVEPDFLAQKEWLREIIEDAGHKILFLPKYHCELNYIENVWGYMKAALRKTCDYNFATLLPKVH